MTMSDLLVSQFLAIFTLIQDSREISLSYIRALNINLPRTFDIQAIVEYIGLDVPSTAQRLSLFVFNTVTSTVNFVISFVVLPFFLFYILYNPSETGKGILRLVPEAFRDDLRNSAYLADGILSKYIRGQLLLSLVVFVAVFIGLSLVGMPNAFALALVAGVMELVPIFGPIIAWLVAFIVAVPLGGDMMIAVTIVSLLVQQAEANFLIPKIQGDSVSLPPWLVMIVIAIAGSIWGLLGMIVGLPLVAIILDIVHYIHTRLQPSAPPPKEALRIVKDTPFEFKKL